MTNPTPPLTAEQWLRYETGRLVEYRDYMQPTLEIIPKWMEAYAAQQNAELVAENERLKQQLATVTNERDALREYAQGYNLAAHTLLTAKEYKKTVRADKQYRLMKDQGWAQLKGAYNKALAQSPPSK